MRYIMKGGVWKNSEDEILKAAIMKYGLNQWSRISSLLQRKSAKQCKQRWYEWLDPSIKKTEWTRGEDQKLLQLSRVFPSQWRTIAPFVGRTPTQCYERYEKLLDIAQGKSIKEAEDLRKLRPGEIDPNPETKPARLDPIDMDEDQKEMLAEVRVRLANTKGKKAKRKQREKVIEEARRLAQLQKLRELEMAGVDNIPTAKEIKRLRQKKDIDYNREIPFKREVPQFVYKLEASETPKSAAFASTITLQTLEGKRRDVEEELQRKLDKRRMKKYRDRDLKSLLKLRNDFEKPAFFPIKLPEPQLTEKDLQDMKKYNITTPLNTLSQMGSSQLMTPQGKILLSARINMSLNHDDSGEMDGVQALADLREMQRRKNVRSIDRVLSEHIKTPSANLWEENTTKLKNLFSNLQKPENTVEFIIPEEEEEADLEEVMDVEQRRRLQAIQAQKNAAKKLKLMSQVMRRALPRPLIIPSCLASTDRVSELITSEVVGLIGNDAIEYPQDGVVFPEQSLAYHQEMGFDELQEARELVRAQVSAMSDGFDEQIYKAGQKRVKLDYGKGQARVIAKPQENAVMAQSFDSYKLNLQNYNGFLRTVESGEKKTRKLLGGYQKVIKAKLQEVNQSQAELARLRRERRTLERLRVRELAGMQLRIAELESYYKLVYEAI